MKQTICILLTICLLAATLCLAVSCSRDVREQVAKDADNYTIVASYDDGAHVLSATQVVQLTNRSENSFDEVKFHIYANQYREDAARRVVPDSYRVQAYPNGDSFGDIAFDSVKVDGNAVAYTIEGQDMDILSVPLDGRQLFPDKQVTVEMTYRVTLANIKHRLGYTDKTVNLGNFYPILCHVDNGNYNCTPYYPIGDPFVSDVANYNVSLTLSDKYVVACSGDLQEAAQSGNCVTYNYTARAMRDFAIVASDQYKKITQNVGEVAVNYYYYNDADSETSLATACGMMEMLSKNLCKYPYAQYSVAETEFCYGGMEYPALSMVTSGSRAYLDAIAHETAHQWFYSLVGNDQINNAWMDEGLAEFVTYLYMDSVNSGALAKNILAATQTYATYVDVLSRYYDKVDRSMRAIDGYKNDSEYVIFTYIKGSLLFNTLYETMGAGKFWKALSDYCAGAQYTVATPAQMIDCFAQVGGKEIGSIFRSFIEGTEIIGKVTDK